MGAEGSRVPFPSHGRRGRGEYRPRFLPPWVQRGALSLFSSHGCKGEHHPFSLPMGAEGTIIPFLSPWAQRGPSSPFPPHPPRAAGLQRPEHAAVRSPAWVTKRGWDAMMPTGFGGPTPPCFGGQCGPAPRAWVHREAEGGNGWAAPLFARVFEGIFPSTHL